MDMGSNAYDKLTGYRVTVLAGAQQEGFRTVQFRDGTIVVVRLTDLIPV
jgi:hypothetical protein